MRQFTCGKDCGRLVANDSLGILELWKLDWNWHIRLGLALDS